MFNKIMVVCTGNICRSPIGEGLLRQALQGKNKTVISAGVGALVGHPADPMAVQVSNSHGLDISGHRAQQTTLGLLSAMDLILTMDQTHSSWILQQYPQLRGRVHKFQKWNGDKDVEDPYRLPLAAFEKAYADIEAGAQRWMTYL
ncbi:low molecular weight phosphotyrosine protein phosphatase [Solimonas sp. K1W22B-7]|uniref:low molecular weight protein-tyrosine-phosphatase n=1 Tax=Solimonas sp. K1W22B-7 TaxID=2303331 RepID=UPI000E32F542|nr:low molecular weight protein-tyrosine-phosphatase [Solimonas sp. K1W22B-7]AXQ29894.1 low molecular weight phosphotyrosine protein phosphatase [Solimonas sp. K1W22B-7]